MWRCGVDPTRLGYERPLIFANFTEGIEAEGDERFVVDTLARIPYVDCDDEDLELGPSTLGGDVTIPVGGGTPTACVGYATAVLGPTGNDPAIAASLLDFHAGGALRVGFGGTLDDAEVRWSLRDAQGDPLAAVTGYTHLSFRIANVVEETDMLACDVPTDEIAFDVVLESESADGSATVAATATIGVLVDAHTDLVTGPCLAGACCRGTQFMQTVRVPLAQFCDTPDGESLDPSSLTSILLRFPDPNVRRNVLIDSIEFTRDPDAVETPLCPQTQHDWNCVATNDLLATETSCAGEPTPDCNAGDIVADDSVPLPEVAADPNNDAFDGWIVHSPRGWIRDPESPTGAEIDDIVALCAAACESEWANEPGVAANCSDAGVFQTPTLRATPGMAAFHRIPDDARSGAGLFAGSSLASDLESDACESFDESLCAAAPQRVTTSPLPLGRGEEWHVNVAGSVYADSPEAPNPVSVGLEGSIGFSHCAGGNASAACPFYLGSLDLEMLAPLTLALECDGQTEVHVLDSMAVRLVQPAFGIAPQGSQWRGFPEGALVFEADGVVDGEAFHAIGPAKRDFKFIANNGWVQLQGYGGSYLELTLPCGEGTAEVVAWIGFNSVSWPGTPPSVNITVPSQVTCPSTVNLTKTLSDAQQDIVSVRWLADGVLLEDGVTSMPFTEAHELTAIVRDARGATYTKRKTVACL